MGQAYGSATRSRFRKTRPARDDESTQYKARRESDKRHTFRHAGGLAEGRPRLMIHDNREGPLARVINEEGVATCYSLGAESQRPGLFLARGKP
jgi:hypothetical protein